MNIEDRGIRLTLLDGDKFKQSISDTTKKLGELDSQINNLNKKTFTGTRLEKGFKDMSGANGIKGLITNLDALSVKFDGLGIVGITVLQRLTNSVITFGHKLVSAVINPLTKGGWQRALNIEQARFQLQGLFGDKTVSIMEDGKKKIVKITDEIEKNAMDAVDATAYGFDASVKVASQLAASGVKAGDEMTTALKGIAGMAAMTGSSFEDMGQIFTTVSGNGRLLSQQLLQFSARGMNAAVTLRDYLNAHEDVRKKVIEQGLAGGRSKEIKEFANATKLTEANVRSLVSSSAIDFKTFSDAMSDAFGEHAKKANDTFTGSLSNLKAAFSRIGADVALEQLTNLRDIFNSITPVVNQARKGLEPFIKIINSDLKTGTKVITTFFKAIANPKFKAKHDEYQQIVLIVEGLSETVHSVTVTVTKFMRMVSEAFSSVFKNVTPLGKVLADLSVNLFLFADGLYFGGQTAKNVRDTFKGLFTIFSMLGKIIKPLFSLIFPLEETGVSFVSLIFSITGAIGRFIVKLDEMLTRLGVFKSVTSAVISVVQGFASIWKSVFSGFSNMLDSIGKTNRIDSAVTGLKNSVKNLGTIPDFVTAVFKRISSGVSGGIKALTESLNNANFKPIVDLFSGGMLLALAANVNRIVQTFTFNIAAGTKELRSIKIALENFRGVLISYSRKLNAEALKNVAVAIAILAGSMLVLSSLDSEALLKSVIAMGVLFQELMASMKVLVGFTTGLKDAVTLLMLASIMKTLATSILMLSVALKIIGNMGWDELFAGLVSIGVLMKMLTSSMNALSSSTISFVKGSTAMITMAVALNILAIAVKQFGSMDLETIAKGLGSVGVMMLALSLFISHTNFRTGFGVKSAVGLLGLAAAMYVMASAVKKIGEVDTKVLAKGLIAMGAIFTEMSIFLNTIKSSKNVLSSAAMLAAFALLLDQMADSFITFSILSWEDIGKGLVVIGGSLLVMAAALRLMGDAKVLAGSVALVGLSLALKLLTPAFETLGHMNLKQIGVALLAMAGAFTVLGVAAALLAPLIVPILGLAAAVALLGIGVGALGAGMLLFTAGAGGFVAALMGVLVELSSVASLMMQSINAILAEIIKAVPGFVSAGAKIIIEFLKGMASKIGGITKQATILIVKFMKSLEDNLPMIIDAAFGLVLAFIKGFADALEKYGPDLLAAIGELIVKIVALVIAATPLMIEGAIKAAKAMVDTFKQYFTELPSVAKAVLKKVISVIVAVVKTFVNAGKTLAKGLYEGFKKAVKEFVSYVKSLPGKLLKALGGHVGEFKTAGENMIKGVISGFKSLFDDALSAIGHFGSGLVSKFKASLGINSPSKKFYQAAVYCVQGFVNGITRSEDDAYDSVSDMANSTVSAMKKAISSVYSFADSELSMMPTITPVVDYSNINRASSSIDSAFANTAFGFGAPKTGIELAENISANIQNGGKEDVASSINRLSKRLESVTNAMNTRQMNNYYNIDGTSDPEAFADSVVNRFKLNARAV